MEKNFKLITVQEGGADFENVSQEYLLSCTVFDLGCFDSDEFYAWVGRADVGEETNTGNCLVIRMKDSEETPR